MKRIIWVFLLAFLLGSCNERSKNTSILKPVTDKNLISELENKSLLSKIDNLETNFNNFIDVLGKSYLSYIPSDAAEFKPRDKGYQLIRSGQIYFIVSLDKISRYANGYKATFLIGNPSLITFGGAKLKIKWGTEPFTEKQLFSSWYNSLKSSEIDINKPLLPGIWNKVTVVLAPAEPKETGYIQLVLQTNGILLRHDSRSDN